jgi:ABC-2 type transport system permease protein
MVLFPILLGVFYKFAFGNLGREMRAIPVAVVENTEDRMFHMMYKKVDESTGGMLDAVYCPEEEAYEKLNNGDVAGVIIIDPADGSAPAASEDTAFMAEIFGADWDKRTDFSDISEMLKNTSLSGTEWSAIMDRMKETYAGETRISLKIRKNGSEQSTLKNYIESFIGMKKMARDLWNASSGGEENNAIESIEEIMNGATITSVPLSKGNRDPLAMYMYNLIAMVSIFGTLAAMHISINSQANLSAIGMRRSCAGTSKSMIILPGLIGTYITHSACVMISITFLRFVLGVDFGDKLPLVYLTGICGAVMGVSLGFFVGSIGRLSEGAKTGIMMAVNMSLCFLSGLMIDSIRAVIAMKMPIINDLNPVAVICDALYYLNMDADLSRYLWKLLSMGIFTLAFIVLGILMTRRQKYASL